MRTTDRSILDRFLAKPEVLRIAGFSAATLWREVQAGRFPAPVWISANRVGFVESEVRAWISSRVDQGRSRSTTTDDLPIGGKDDDRASRSDHPVRDATGPAQSRPAAGHAEPLTLIE